MTLNVPLFGKKTTASVMASFNKTLSDLREVEASHKKEAEDREIEIAQKQAERAAALSEAQSASAVASRLEALIGGVLENSVVTQENSVVQPL